MVFDVFLASRLMRSLQVRVGQSVSAVSRRRPPSSMCPRLGTLSAQLCVGFVRLCRVVRSSVLVGRQMTALHLAEHGRTAHRPTDDGDMVVGVWTRRDALRSTTNYLTSNGFTDRTTSDGYGYRFVRGKIDVMIPEGLDRQRRYPTTGSGRPGLSADGGNQALTRAERLPIRVNDQMGYVCRPTLLGAIVAKARAWVVDRRDPERHAQDLIALAEVALRDARAIISQTRPDDLRAVRAALRGLPTDHRLWRAADDAAATRNLLNRLAQPPN